MASRKFPASHYVRTIVRDVVAHPANRRHRARALARAVRWQLHKRVGGGPVDVPFEGYVLRCYPDSASASNVVYFTARYDWDEMAFLERYLRRGDRFVDVGANIGTYSLLARRLVGPEGQVVAIEPLPLAAARLRENLERNGLVDVEVHQVAVDDHEGTAGFLDFDVSSALDHVADHRGRTPFEVTVRRLDDLVGQREVAAAKLDVEGAEHRALLGAEAMLASHSPPVWLVEVMDWQLPKFGSSTAELTALFADHGFDPFRYVEADGRLVPWADADGINRAFVARDRLDEVIARLDQRPN